jgi:formylglycine-generating enzyme required for sulfatase activity
MWTPGKELQKGYRIESILGQGGFGIAYKARHLKLNHQVVIKTPNASLQNDPEYPKYVQRFEQEGQILARLGSNHQSAIVRVSDLFEEEGILCLVMDLIVGDSLWDIVQKKGALSEEKALPIIRQIGEALIVVHQAGIIHRDAHPGNILLRNNGAAVLIDFGIAAEILPTGCVNSSMHPANQVFAPYEQFVEGSGKPSVDVYCLASSLYYVITGKLPTKALERKLRNASLDAPKQLVRTISDRVNNTILRGMALEPENRYQTMEEFVTSLQSIPSKPVVIKPIPPTVPSVSPSPIPAQKTVKIVPSPSPEPNGFLQNMFAIFGSNNQPPEPVLQTFSFETVKVNNQGKIISRQPSQAQYFTENLGNGIIIEMVYIPGGTFLMGSPETEAESNDWEKPQHQVTIQPFFMGKYTATQAQWKAVTKLPKIERDLDPAPSYFKGDNRPVECVLWRNAVEFCARLSKKTGRNYRLPSEAEWEYACRAGTTTPFHFGETITPDLANYNGNYTYLDAPKGKYREETTDVGSFPPNAFGLYEMHGNVWEWCADPWHGSYEGLPTDGSIWDEKNNNNPDQNSVDLLIMSRNDDRRRLLRGGSWGSYPRYSRSAFRVYDAPVTRYGSVGFRFVCVAAWT